MDFLKPLEVTLHLTSTSYFVRGLGIFKATEMEVAAQGSFADTMGEAKKRYMKNDLARFVRERGVELRWPSHHPRRSILALRTLLFITCPESPHEGARFDMWTVVKRLYRAYWVEGVDISNPTDLAQVLAPYGVDEALIDKANNSDFAKDSLSARTQEAVDRGLFGVPSFFVTIGGNELDRMVYGQDQLELLEKLLGGKPSLLEIASKPPTKLYPVTFYFDFASPYTYLSSLHVERLFGSHVSFVPVLLGAIFKGVGQHNTPAATMCAARRNWSTREIFSQFAELEAPFQWASRFPIRTILPLRFTIAAGPNTAAGRKLIPAFFNAFWAQDLDPNDPQTCIKIANDCGLDGAALFEKTNTPEVKNTLQQNTAKALEQGVFGLPLVRKFLLARKTVFKDYY